MLCSSEACLDQINDFLGFFKVKNPLFFNKNYTLQEWGIRILKMLQIMFRLGFETATRQINECEIFTETNIQITLD